MLASATLAASGTTASSTASMIGSPAVFRPRAGLVRIGSGFAALASLAFRPPKRRRDSCLGRSAKPSRQSCGRDHSVAEAPEC